MLPVTPKVTVQLPPDGIVIPLKDSAVEPAVSVAGVVPLHVPPTAPPAALMPASVSVNDAPVSALPLEFAKVSVTVELPPDWIDPGEKPLAIVGAAYTVKVAVLLAAPAVGVCVVVTPEA